MVTETQEAPSVEQLTQERNEAQSAIEGLHKGLASAVKAFERAVKDGADTETILDLGDKVRALRGTEAVGYKDGEIGKAEAVVASITKRIEFAEWQVNSRDLSEANARIYAGFQELVAQELATLERFGATQVNGSVVLSGDGTGGVKAIGDRIPKQPSKGKTRAASNGGGGFSSHGKIVVGGVEYPSTNAAYRTLRGAADGVAPNDVTAANNKSATSWLEKNVGTVTSA